MRGFLICGQAFVPLLFQNQPVNTGNLEFYKKVDAKTVLIPISAAGDRTMRSDMYGDAPAVNRYAEDNADAVYKAFEGTVEIEL